MAKQKKGNTVTIVTELIRPVADRLQLMLWDVRFEKEGAAWFLRIFIDKDGGVSIDDCETMSRAIDPLLDEADPIEQSYYLEVSSPGVERELRYDWHFKRYLGSAVRVRLIRPVEGVRDFTGILQSFEKGRLELLLDEESSMELDLEEAAYVKLVDDYDDLGGLKDE